MRFVGDATAERPGSLEGALDHLGEEAAEAEEHATALLALLKKGLEALEPFEPADLGIHVLAINPEGGAHPVTQDRRALHAALAATDACLARLPYVDERYGARGRRFTDSDGAYLAFLLDEAPEVRAKRIDWVGRLLAARGMPTSVLELHLEILADELDRALPEHANAHQRLREEAARLRSDLARWVTPERRRELARRYAERATGDAADERALEHGSLVVDAICNEASGHRKAVESLVLWVVAPERATERSIAAIAELLDGARSAASA